MTHGTKHLRFGCTACGACCHEFRVPLTGGDVRRLVRGLGVSEPSIFVEWLGADAVDMVGEPETLVLLPEGRRLLVLRQTGGACDLLQGNRCSVYGSRPRSCRLYPWDVSLGRRGGVKHLRLLHHLPACEATFDGYLHPNSLAEQKRLERAELEEYVECVSQWNMSQRRRGRLGKPLRSARAFLQQLSRGAVPG